MTQFDGLAEQVLQGHSVTREEGLEILQTDEAQLLPLVNAAYTISPCLFWSNSHHPNAVQRQERRLSGRLSLLFAIQYLHRFHRPVCVSVCR